eukprot:CAMPEP_0205863092 /NCGR_PEP_ID=MMETSP1083-20121108/6642_1 /ASSEMBLY_ACC=CAM_ASM_000430 /TAXON_ID=97485 /ORGANISM="Prymnesium parvum, Strain Texoma1" /LENGTH=66 /DNA_ID=CAMNT_0053224887 /DNA_START=364 /DNA_END=560 /DNA_ORIENTATION=+
MTALARLAAGQDVGGSRVSSVSSHRVGTTQLYQQPPIRAVDTTWCVARAAAHASRYEPNPLPPQPR